MNDSPPVGRLGGIGQGRHQIGGLASRLGCSVQFQRETAAFDEFHRVVGPPVRVPHVVDLHDVGVLKSRHSLGLSLESLTFTGTGIAPARTIFNATIRFKRR